MEPYIKTIGGQKLFGELYIQGSKNASLPILAAAVLCRGTVRLLHVPDISDVTGMVRILTHMGARVERQGDCLEIHNEALVLPELPHEMTGQMRCSIVFLGALLGRFGCAVVGMPGGCVIGERPIDLHLAGLRQMGVELTVEEDRLLASTKKLTGARVILDFPSVGATENILLAAVLAEGTTTIQDCACEPEVVELCHFLLALGANIKGIGTSTLVIRGVSVDSLKRELQYRIGGDRIAAATYLTAPVICGGEVFVRGIDPWILQCMHSVWMRMGARVRTGNDYLAVTGPERPRGVDYLCTKPHPGFPTDMQSIVMVALCLAEGTSVIEEKIFESRFSVAEELKKCNARLKIVGSRVMIEGVSSLSGAKLQAKDLRGAAALVLAGLAAQGESHIYGLSYLKRGYEDFVPNLRRIGAKVCEISAVQ